MVAPKKVKITVEEKYKMKTLHEHILTRPDSYIGSVKGDMREMWIWSDDTKMMEKKDIMYIQGLHKIFDEILVNAKDNTVVNENCRTIKVTVDKVTGTISVWNDGSSIPIEIHKEHNIYVPEMIFGNLLTSSNYNDEEERITGGLNGYGSKLASIYSTYFSIELVDSTLHKKYKQVFENNMFSVGAPEIEPVSNKTKSYIKVSFMPDYEKFGLKGLTNDMANLFKKRVYDIAACVPQGCKVYLNDELIKVENFQDYIKLYYVKFPSNPVYEEVNDRWKVCAIYDPNSEFWQMSFVNGICTYKGGSHINHVLDQITKRLSEYIKEKHKLNIKPYQIKERLTLFVDSIIVKPHFGSQTKEELGSKVATFGSKCELSDEFIKQLTKTGIVDDVVQMAQFKEMNELKKTDGKKTTSLRGVDKYDPASWAGTAKSKQCRLILTEGDSAKSFALAGTEIIGREKYGVFPLKGKPLNVREATAKQLLSNEEFNNIKKILGLKQNKKYTDCSGLNYGGIIILADQDDDGHHIKGLLINMIHRFWPSLLINVPDFIQTLATPIVKVFKKSDTKKAHPKIFYTLSEYEEWIKNELNGETKNWTIKYYKGLGTSTDKEAKESFIDFDNKLISYIWEHSKDDKNSEDDAVVHDKNEDQNNSDDEASNNGDESSENEVSECDQDDDDDNDFQSKSFDAITLAFQKSRANERKNWLFNYNKNDIIMDGSQKITFSDFVHKVLKHFSNSDNVRSIPSLCDGFKPSQRKILFAAFKKKLFTEEIKVAQFAGYVSENAEYHHGEASLQGAIISMAQTFVGSNNINLLRPEGTFGSRRQGGKDAASARYIHTFLSSLAPKIFRKEDEKIYNYINEDGTIVEPEHYSPIIPMILVNGALGIGTGFSTDIPPFNPLEIVANLRRLIDGLDPKEMMPWFRGFTGTIKVKDGKILSTGKWEVMDESTLQITELPIGLWTDKYKEFLDSLLITDKNDTVSTHIISRYENLSSNNIIKFVITFASNNLQTILKTNAIEKKMKLTSSIPMTNMYMYNPDGVITKYETVEEILLDFYKHRLDMYDRRKKYMIRLLENQLNIIKYKILFVEGILTKNAKTRIIMENKKRVEVLERLEELKFPKLSSDPDCPESEKSYDYTNMSLWSVTLEKIEELNKEFAERQKDLDDYNSITLEELWKRELDEFVEAYNKWLIEQEEADGNPKQKGKKTKGEKMTVKTAKKKVSRK